MIPWHCADEVLDDPVLDSDQRRDVLSILAWHVGQQPLEVKVYIALASFRLKRSLLGHHEVAQTVNHMGEDIEGNAAITQ